MPTYDGGEYYEVLVVAGTVVITVADERYPNDTRIGTTWAESIFAARENAKQIYEDWVAMGSPVNQFAAQPIEGCREWLTKSYWEMKKCLTG